MAMTATAVPNRVSPVRNAPSPPHVDSTDEVTIDRAAEMFDLLPDFVVSLVRSQRIPSRFDGVNVVVRPADIEACRAVERELRHKVLDEMVAESQKMGLYQ